MRSKCGVGQVRLVCLSENWPRVLLLAVLLAMGHAPICAGADSWGVLAPGLPDRVSVADEETNVSFYILKQTHEPLFRRKDGENYSSKILKSWGRSLDYRDFSFCLKSGQEFAPGVQFNDEDFYEYVSSFTSGNFSNATVLKEGGCVRVSFKYPQKDYLYFWTQYAHAPTKNAAGRAELGLGPFFAKSISKSKVELSRKKPNRGGYNSVILYDYKGVGDVNLENREIKDFNLINTDAVPGWVKNSFQSFDNPEMKSLILLINHPDPKVRSRVYNCIDIPALRSAFYPGKTDFYSISTVLPMGVPGAVPGLPVQSCVPGGDLGTELRFANWMSGNREGMEKFAADFKAKSGISIRLEQYGMSEFAKAFYQRPKPFALAVILVYVTSSPKEFFSMFFKNGETYDFETEALSRNYRKLLKFPERTTTETFFRELSSEVADAALALPISQSRRTLYYPREIMNLNVGSGILEYPEVAEFRR